MTYENKPWEEVFCGEEGDFGSECYYLFERLDPKKEDEVPFFEDDQKADEAMLPSAFLIRLGNATCPNCGFRGLGEEVFNQANIGGPRGCFDFQNRSPFLKLQKKLNPNQIGNSKYADVKNLVPKGGFVRRKPNNWDGVTCKKCSSSFVVQLLLDSNNMVVWNLFSVVDLGERGVGFSTTFEKDFQDLYNKRLHQFIEDKGTQKEVASFVCYGPTFKNP